VDKLTYPASYPVLDKLSYPFFNSLPLFLFLPLSSWGLTSSKEWENTNDHAAAPNASIKFSRATCGIQWRRRFRAQKTSATFLFRPEVHLRLLVPCRAPLAWGIVFAAVACEISKMLPPSLVGSRCPLSSSPPSTVNTTISPQQRAPPAVSPRISPEAQFLIALARVSTAAVFAAVDSWAPPQELHMQSKATRAGGRRKKKLPSKQARLVASWGAFFLRLEAEKDPPPHGSRCSGGSRTKPGWVVSGISPGGRSVPPVRQRHRKTLRSGVWRGGCRDSDAVARYLARLLPHFQDCHLRLETGFRHSAAERSCGANGGCPPKIS
jgi:hypothetical protein